MTVKRAIRIYKRMTKEDKKNKYITTDNRQITIDKRETSYEGLVSKFENGEDGVYNLINNAMSFTGDDKVIKIKIREENKKYIVSIIDTGKGIKKKDLKKVHLIFF